MRIQMHLLPSLPVVGLLNGGAIRHVTTATTWWYIKNGRLMKWHKQLVNAMVVYVFVNVLLIN